MSIFHMITKYTEAANYSVAYVQITYTAYILVYRQNNEIIFYATSHMSLCMFLSYIFK